MADPGFPIGGVLTCWGGANLQRVHFSAKTYAKMKEIDPVGGGRPGGAPLDPPMYTILGNRNRGKIHNIMFPITNVSDATMNQNAYHQYWTVQYQTGYMINSWELSPTVTCRTVIITDYTLYRDPREKKPLCVLA